ncbi:adenylate/guanylate cyclase domain-containing protein [Phenylobacterium sp.]|uniref:adenylate/guanylate cyclase domain-containing protein n=1 Tax=Phenylobacterium sp. TaxID=1871053 RepID=UPI0025E19F81|nr:adenylate/guanylate cyclase domain-containing protein [Phenylobacterium sp.]
MAPQDERRRYLSANDVGLFPEDDAEGPLLRAERQRSRDLQRTFSQYIPPQVVEQLMANPGANDLCAETRDLTILFADIRGFTSMSEALKDDPRRLGQLINTVLGALADIVGAHGGTIDKYVGDCVMAFWGAPQADTNHARHAVAAAEAMLAAIDGLNASLDLSLPDGRTLPPIQIGVGVNSGECLVGAIGCARRFNYSALGDAVNIASRLVDLTKTYDVHLLIGEATVQRLAPSPRWREVDRVAVRGRIERQSLFTLSPVAATAANDDLAWPQGQAHPSVH